MIKYFFFKTVRVNGRQKLHALPGQLTYKDRCHRFEPVDVEWDVQVERPQRTIHAAYPDGTTYVGKIEGDSQRDTKLLFHSRDGVSFYRFTGTLKPVFSDERLYTDESHRLSPEETVAWLNFAGARANAAPDTAASPVSAPATPQPVTHLTREQMMRLANLPEDDINEMSAYVNTQADLQAVLLMLSQLRDRMAVGVAKFTYIKQNGDTRVAYGTRCHEIIERRPNANETQSRRNDGAHFCYYDMQRQDWRCFCVHDFVGLDLDYLAQSASQIALIPSSL